MTTRSEPCRPADMMTPNEARQMLGLGPLSPSPSTNLKPLICDRCFGKINSRTMTCEYCGTRFVSGNVEDFNESYPLVISHEQAEQRRKEIEKALSDTNYGIAIQNMYDHALRSLRK